MFRNLVIARRPISVINSTWTSRGPASSLRFYSPHDDISAQDLSEARTWLSEFDLETIPKKVCEVTFSRSSGPGGQNVNKVSSKATLRVTLRGLLPLVPQLLHEPIRRCQYYAAKSNSLVIQADDSRKQSENTQTCFVRLHRLILEVGEKALPGETSEEQKVHVRNLREAEKEKRLKMKKLHSSKKSSRRSSGSVES